MKSIDTKVIQDEEVQCFLPVELRLLRKPKVFHRIDKGVKIPDMKVCMKLQGERSLDIILRLQMRLRKMQLGTFFLIMNELLR